MSTATPTQRIVQILESSGKTKKSFAAAIGVPATTLQSWIGRGSDIPSQYVVPASKFLGVSPLWILTGDDDPKVIVPDSFVELSEDERFLVDSFRSLDREGKIVVSNCAVEELRRFRALKGDVG